MRPCMVLLFFAFGGCDATAILDAWAATPPTFDCGRFTPDVGLKCGTIVETDTTERALIAGETTSLRYYRGSQNSVDDVDPELCTISNFSTDPGRHTQAVLHATCSAITPSTGEDARWSLQLKAMTSRVCVSHAYVRLEWSGSVSIPEGRHLLTLDAMATRNLGATDAEDCVAYVGDDRVDPISPGRKNVYLRAVDGPSVVPVSLDCNRDVGGIERGLEGSSCTATGDVDLNSPPTAMTDLTLEIGVARLP